MYEHSFSGEKLTEHSQGKIVCVGRNYAAHASELNNPIPTEPILFIKPSTAAVAMELPLSIPNGRGSCHYETEIAVLIAEPLTNASVEQCQQAIVGVGVAFDLTLRDVQADLKKKGLPWEKAKAFDGSCPLSQFVSSELITDWNNIELRMYKNNTLCQSDTSRSMITPILTLVSYISEHFTLLPGDVVLTGTPKGVGELVDGDQLTVELEGVLKISTHVHLDAKV